MTIVYNDWMIRIHLPSFYNRDKKRKFKTSEILFEIRREKEKLTFSVRQSSPYWIIISATARVYIIIEMSFRFERTNEFKFFVYNSGLLSL